jgi:hypothetical protein
VKSFNYYDLLDAFVLSGCPVCRLLTIDSDRFLQLVLRESTTDPGFHSRLRSSLGMCNQHAWQLRDYKGWSSGVAAIHEAALDELIVRLREARPTPLKKSLLKRLFPPHLGAVAADRLRAEKRCQCCQLLDEAETRYLKTIAQYFGQDTMQEAFRASDGLCFPHFRAFLGWLDDAELAQIAIDAQIRKYESLKLEIDLFLSNLDGRQTGGQMGPEGDSWIRGILSTVGARGVFSSQRRTGKQPQDER